jgi:hypothetical protein
MLRASSVKAKNLTSAQACPERSRRSKLRMAIPADRALNAKQYQMTKRLMLKRVFDLELRYWDLSRIWCFGFGILERVV